MRRATTPLFALAFIAIAAFAGARGVLDDGAPDKTPSPALALILPPPPPTPPTPPPPPPTTTTTTTTAPTTTPDPVVEPTPETSPPPPRSGSVQSAYDEIVAGLLGAGFDAGLAPLLWRIADCESGYKLSAGVDPYAQNANAVGAQGELGLWQIHPIHFGSVDPELLRTSIAYGAAVAAGMGTASADGFARHWRICGY